MALHYDQKAVEPEVTWNGPGKFYLSGFGEAAQRAFWRRWLEYMKAEGSDEREPVQKDACHG
jgi:hypothetical protein